MWWHSDRNLLLLLLVYETINNIDNMSFENFPKLAVTYQNSLMLCRFLCCFVYSTAMMKIINALLHRHWCQNIDNNLKIYLAYIFIRPRKNSVCVCAINGKPSGWIKVVVCKMLFFFSRYCPHWIYTHLKLSVSIKMF